MNVGIDLVLVERFENYERIARKIFSEYEYALYLNSTNKKVYVASRFCLKEAFLKSIKTGILDINLREIEVIKEDSGAVHICYQEKEFSASLSHEGNYCVGVVIND